MPAEQSCSAFAALTSPVVSWPLLPVKQWRCSSTLTSACETIVRIVSQPLAPLEPAAQCLCAFVALTVTLYHSHLVAPIYSLFSLFFGRLSGRSNAVCIPTWAPVVVRDVMHVCEVTSAHRCKVILGSSPHLSEAFGVLKRIHSPPYDAMRRWEAVQKLHLYQKKSCNERWATCMVRLVSHG